MTGRRPDTWMPLYWGDYLRDTMHLSTCQHGAYLLLLACYWTKGRPLPDDDAQLACIARMTPEEWSENKAVIAEFFQIESGRFWRQKRVDAELEKANSLSKARQEAGKRGGKAKANVVANAKQNPTPSPSPSHTLISNEIKGATAPSADLHEMPLASFSPIDGDWSRALFGRGLYWLAATVGRPPGKLRSTLGQFLKLSGQDHHAVYDLLAEAQAAGVAEPVEWIMRRLQPKPDVSDALTKAMASL